MEQSITYKNLVDAFREIGIERGTILEVHSSLSSFGYVEGGAETVISALKDVVGTDGSI
ncbi:MAG: AAC(3) family N-acetyltransferase, partial [Clostridia bacterium]|nr:AAC(3) family N-acetyltransferase [Clostridia bacterium]